MQKKSYIIPFVLVTITILIVIGIILWFRRQKKTTTDTTTQQSVEPDKFTYKGPSKTEKSTVKSPHRSTRSVAHNSTTIDPIDIPLTELEIGNCVKLKYDNFIRKSNGKICKLSNVSPDAVYDLGEEVPLDRLIVNINDFKRNKNVSLDDASFILKYYNPSGDCVLKIKYDETGIVEVNNTMSAGFYKNAQLKSISYRAFILRMNQEILSDLANVPTIRYINCKNINKSIMFLVSPNPDNNNKHTTTK